MKPAFLHRALQCKGGNVETFARVGTPTTSAHVSVMFRVRGISLFAVSAELTPDEARVHAQHLIDGANVADGKGVAE